MPADAMPLRKYVIYQCVVGSRAFGLEQTGSDVDRRGFYLPPADLHWSLDGVPEQLESDQEECYWELGKFIRLALKANPNILECLYSPVAEVCSPLAAELVAMRAIFLSQQVHRTFHSYAQSQFRKLDQDIRTRGTPRWKHVMHLIRLLISGATALREGFLPLRVDDALRDRLLAIRRGEVPWEEVEGWRLRLHREMDDALAVTRLPELPDVARANDFLVRARRRAALPAYAENPIAV
jgi:predicted nucleotidyltransferase